MLLFRFSFLLPPPGAMTQVSVSLGLPPRPPKRELLSHDLELENSDYSSSGEEDGGSSSKNRSSSRACAGGGGSAQPLSGASADCEGPNWKASVQQFDNFLCRVHAQVRRNGDRSSERGRERAGNASMEGKKFWFLFYFFARRARGEAKLFSQVKRSLAPCRRSTALFVPRVVGPAIPATAGDEERWR